MRRGNARAGSVLIEFAGSLLLLSTLFAGIFRIGYTFYAYQNLVNAVRAGARYASRGPGGADPESVRNLVVYGETRPAPGAKPVVPGLTPGNVELSVQPRTATVSVHGFEIDSVFMKVRLDGRPTVTFPLAQGVAK